NALFLAWVFAWIFSLLVNISITIFYWFNIYCDLFGCTEDIQVIGRQTSWEVGLILIEYKCNGHL
ncbi:hypothetical protein ACOHX4_002008, partial [Yersinia enterocolitica]